ncbi:MAG: WD40 repeat domain-containing protein [Planctomycetaceae bacterium]
MLRHSKRLIVLAALVANGCDSDSSVVPSKVDSPAGGAPTVNSQPDSTGSSATQPASELGDSGKTSTKSSPPPATPSDAQVAKWGIENNEPLQLLTCDDDFSDSFLQCMAITPDGKQFVLGGSQLTLWNATDSEPKINLLGKYKDDEVERPILSVAITSDGEHLAAGDQNGKLRVWKLSDQSEVYAIQAHDARLTQIAFTPDSKTMATTSYAGEVRLWESTDGKEIKSLKVDDQEISRLVFLSDTLLATSGREAGIWNIESGEKVTAMTTGYVIGPALGLSNDRRLLAFADSESKTQLWDVEKGKATAILGAAAKWIEFSRDNKLIATYSGDSTIRIWNAATRQIVQVIDADGDRTVALKWLPESNALVVASERGRIRIWGTAATATTLAIQPIQQPELETIATDSRRSMNPAQFKQVVDVRSFPRLPEAVAGWSYGGMDAYNTPASQSEAELFYRYYLGKAGWTEIAENDPLQPGLNFQKTGCRLNVSLSPATTSTPGLEGDLQVSLRFVGNYDVRWLPKISPIESNSTLGSFSLVSYRTQKALTDVEVAILKKFHEAGWTAYTRLAASSTEDPRSRTISMLQGASELTVSIGYPADSTDEVIVQTSINVSNKSLPIPADSGWIEFDSSTDLQMVAHTKMDLKQTVEFYDKQMAWEGWLARDAGRHIEDDKGWLAYLRGQQDVLIRLVSLPDGKTRILVGEAESSSWQLEEPKVADAAAAQAGIEAADFKLPKGATAVSFDVDQKQIQYELSSTTPPKLGELFIKQMKDLEWTQDGAGVQSDEYVFLTFTKDDVEIQLRARAKDKKSTVMIDGDGLLWSKPLPTAAVRISYETWLRRNHKNASLDDLDEFAKAMHEIPADAGKNK